MRLNENDFDVLPKAGEENGYGDSLSRFQLCYLLFTYEEMNNFVINSKKQVHQAVRGEAFRRKPKEQVHQAVRGEAFRRKPTEQVHQAARV